MPAALCAKCRAPLSREESRSGKCPFCAAPLESADAAAVGPAALPPPVDERAAHVPAAQAVKPFLRGVAILLVLAAGGGGLYYAVSAGVTRYLGGAESHPQAESPAPETWPEDPPAAEAQAKADTLAAPAAAPPAEAIGVGRVRKIDSPEGEYVVEPMDGAAQVYLRGRVKVLRIGRLYGDVLLDASNLEAREVRFTGAIGGRAKARVHAPNGSVEFRAPVTGRAGLNIDAAGGRVTFPKRAAGGAGAEISGDPRMVIKAREVDFQVPINGGTQVSVVLTSGGKLRFTEMNGSSRLLYRKAAPGDPDPVVDWGIVRDESRCRENR